MSSTPDGNGGDDSAASKESAIPLSASATSFNPTATSPGKAVQPQDPKPSSVPPRFGEPLVHRTRFRAVLPIKELMRLAQLLLVAVLHLVLLLKRCQAALRLTM